MEATTTEQIAYVTYGIGTASVYTGTIVGYVTEARDYAKVDNGQYVATVSVRNIYPTAAEAEAVAAAAPKMTTAEMCAAYGYGQGRYQGD